MGSRFDFPLPRLWAGGLILLILGTWPLWLSSLTAVAGDYPRVVWGFSPPSPIVVIIELSLTLALLGACLKVLYSEANRPHCWIVIGFVLAALVCLDQHRLQPWIYQTLIYSVIFATCGPGRVRQLAIAVTIGIYFYSSLGKFDFQFAHTVGRDMIQAIIGRFILLNDATAVRLAFALPATEMLAAILIMFPRTRRYGGMIAILMHATLLVLFSPLALGHSWGVLAWNLVLASQAWLLFVRPPAPVSEGHPAATSSQWGASLAIPLVVLTLVAPLSERYGYWDHWTSWALYSPHNSRCEIQFHRSVTDKLPLRSRGFLLDDEDGDGWHEFDLGTFSLQERWVPVYPQARYQLQIAGEFASQWKLEEAIRVKLRGVSDRWTGRRQEVYLIGEKEINETLKKYWLARK